MERLFTIFSRTHPSSLKAEMIKVTDGSISPVFTFLIFLNARKVNRQGYPK
jgi:hypothetical protein